MGRPTWKLACIRRAGFAHRLLCVVLAVLYVTVMSGVPIPIPMPASTGLAKAGKDRSIPFPCMDRPCGCATAEECWRDCCCFSPAEHVAWAKANGVAIPSFAVLPSDDHGDNAKVVGKRSCCSGTQHHHDHDHDHNHDDDDDDDDGHDGHAGGACETESRNSPSPSRGLSVGQGAAAPVEQAGDCCQKKPVRGESCCTPKTVPSRTPLPKKGRWVVGIQALGCRGQNGQWLTLSTVHPPTVVFGVIANPSTEILPADMPDSRLIYISDLPTPPPRAC